MTGVHDETYFVLSSLQCPILLLLYFAEVFKMEMKKMCVKVEPVDEADNFLSPFYLPVSSVAEVKQTCCAKNNPVTCGIGSSLSDNNFTESLKCESKDDSMHMDTTSLENIPLLAQHFNNVFSADAPNAKRQPNVFLPGDCLEFASLHSGVVKTENDSVNIEPSSCQHDRVEAAQLCECDLYFKSECPNKDLEVNTECLSDVVEHQTRSQTMGSDPSQNDVTVNNVVTSGDTIKLNIAADYSWPQPSPGCTLRSAIKYSDPFIKTDDDFCVNEGEVLSLVSQCFVTIILPSA